MKKSGRAAKDWASYMAARRAQHRKDGLCTFCVRPVWLGRTTCRKHTLANRARMARRPSRAKRAH